MCMNRVDNLQYQCSLWYDLYMLENTVKHECSRISSMWNFNQWTWPLTSLQGRRLPLYTSVWTNDVSQQIATSGLSCWQINCFVGASLRHICQCDVWCVMNPFYHDGKPKNTNIWQMKVLITSTHKQPRHKEGLHSVTLRVKVIEVFIVLDYVRFTQLYIE